MKPERKKRPQVQQGPPSAKAQAEAKVRKAQPLRVLPAAWYEPGVAEGMAEYIRRANAAKA